MSEKTPQVDKWILSHPGGPAGPFWGIVTQSGRVIALQILERENAEILRLIGNVLAGDIDTIRIVTDCVDSIFDETIGPMMIEPASDYLVRVIVEALMSMATERNE